MTDTNSYKQLLALTNVDVLIENDQWYHSFDPYCIFEDGKKCAIFRFATKGTQTIWKFDAPKNSSVSIWAKVESEKKH